jgi:hypothetical protein
MMPAATTPNANPVKYWAVVKAMCVVRAPDVYIPTS